MWKFKSCPRCNGDILLDRDHYGWYGQCLQCGYQHDLKSIVEAQQQAEIKNKMAASESYEQGSLSLH